MLINALCTIQAQETANSRQARRIFNSAYQQVFGEKGATLHYDVNITGLYKTHGEVEIHTAKNNKSDKYSQKFKFEPDNYTYSVALAEGGLMVTLKLIKGKKGMKEIHALLERNTYSPISVKIKIAFIWTTIDAEIS